MVVPAVGVACVSTLGIRNRPANPTTPRKDPPAMTLNVRMLLPSLHEPTQGSRAKHTIRPVGFQASDPAPWKSDVKNLRPFQLGEGSGSFGLVKACFLHQAGHSWMNGASPDVFPRDFPNPCY